MYVTGVFLEAVSRNIASNYHSVVSVLYLLPFAEPYKSIDAANNVL